MIFTHYSFKVLIVNTLCNRLHLSVLCNKYFPHLTLSPNIQSIYRSSHFPVYFNNNMSVWKRANQWTDERLFQLLCCKKSLYSMNNETTIYWLYFLLFFKAFVHYLGSGERDQKRGATAVRCKDTAFICCRWDAGLPIFNNFLDVKCVNFWEVLLLYLIT